MNYIIRWLRVYIRYRLTRYDVLVQRGIIATSVLLGAVALLSFMPTCEGNDCQMRLISFWYAPANEIGDTFAGIAGALAFLWIIVTVMMQSKELTLQRQELKLTRQEMAEQRKATQEVARSISYQNQSVELALRQSREAQAGEVFDQQLLAAKAQIANPALELVYWEFNRKQALVFPKKWDFVSKELLDIKDIDDFFVRLGDRLCHLSTDVEVAESMGRLTRKPVGMFLVREILHRCRVIESVAENLSESQRVRYKKLKLGRISASLETLLNDALWGDQKLKKTEAAQ